MAEKKKRRKLSFLQKEYRKYFLKKLEEYEVKSPAQLDKAKKSEFFGGIPEDWLSTKKDLNKTRINNIIRTGKEEASFNHPRVDGSYREKSSKDIFVCSSISDIGEIELVQENNASNIYSLPFPQFKENFVPVKIKAASEIDSPLSIALIECSEITATLNMLLRTVLKSAPEDIKTSAREALKCAKELLQKLTGEIRED